MKFFHGIRMKILLYTSLCVALVCIAGNLFIYTYLMGLISSKAEELEQRNAEFIAVQLNAELDKAWNLVTQCANNQAMILAAESRITNDNARFRQFLNAQQVMTGAIAASGLNEYINRMVLVRLHDDYTIQASNQQDYGNLQDARTLRQNELFQELTAVGGASFFVFSETSLVSPQSQHCLISLVPVTSGPQDSADAWLYTELSPRLFTDVLTTFEEVGTYHLTMGDGQLLVQDSGQPSLDSIAQLYSSNPHWQLEQTPLLFGFSLYSAVDTLALRAGELKITYTVLAALVTSLLAGIGIAVILSIHLSRPIHRLTNRIQRIKKNDFSYDPSIEQGQDEISQIGKVVNEMTLSVRNLLQETQEHADQKRRIEIAMLQSQVNPHFLYNTLDSIHWMAVIQKNIGIQQMTRALSNLLKNMAKGYDQKVPLREELSLLQDYLTIQSFRYLDTFEVKYSIPEGVLECPIVKMTLQPLVENAIFHGIEPTGRFGTIEVRAWEQGDCLFVCVEDDGVGMDATCIQQALQGTTKTGAGSMNGIGVENVHNRLRLVYGAPYGLTIESEPGRYTRVTVQIPKERGQENAV